MELQKMRQSIDRIDSELVQLLTRRMEYAIRTRRFKEGVADSEREEQILNRIRSLGSGFLGSQFLEETMKLVMAEGRRLQELNLPLAAFLGEHGAYSELAVKGYREDVVGIPCRQISDIVDGVRNGGVDYGILPVENSVEGSVDQAEQLLIETELFIIGEVLIPVRHALLTLRETDYRDIKEVFSHPKALGQCQGFLKRNKLEGRPWYDCAAAAGMLVRERPTSAAVIASPECAKLYDLEILKEGIEDSSVGASRYLILSKSPTTIPGDKCSIVFTTQNRAGALFETLKIFSEASINLTRIESRPLKKQPNQVAFLLDFMGSDKDTKIKAVLDRLSQTTSQCRLLGCYKAAPEMK